MILTANCQINCDINVTKLVKTMTACRFRSTRENSSSNFWIGANTECVEVILNNNTLNFFLFLFIDYFLWYCLVLYSIWWLAWYCYFRDNAWRSTCGLVLSRAMHAPVLFCRHKQSCIYRIHNQVFSKITRKVYRNHFKVEICSIVWCFDKYTYADHFIIHTSERLSYNFDEKSFKLPSKK